MMYFFFCHWYFHTSFLYFHTNLKFCIIKKIKKLLSTLLFSLTLLATVQLYRLSRYFLSLFFPSALPLFSVLSLPFFFPFLCAPVFIKPNRWVSVWRGDGWLSRPWVSRSRPGLKILVWVLFAWASRSQIWKFWFCLLESFARWRRRHHRRESRENVKIWERKKKLK